MEAQNEQQMSELRSAASDLSADASALERVLVCDVALLQRELQTRLCAEICRGETATASRTASVSPASNGDLGGGARLGQAGIQ
jgi:hypothetical protein